MKLLRAPYVGAGVKPIGSMGLRGRGPGEVKERNPE